MARTVKYPIRAKIALLCVSITVLATGAYLAMAVALFHQDKRELVYELNSSSVRALTGEVDGFIRIARENVRLAVQLYPRRELIEAVLGGDPDIESFSLFQREAQEWRSQYSYLSRGFRRSIDAKEIPWERLDQSGLVAWNSSVKDSEQGRISIAVKVFSKNSADPDWIGVVNYRARTLLDRLSGRSIAEVFAIDPTGRIFLHPKASHSFMDGGGQDPFLSDILKNPLRAQVQVGTWNGEEWLSAFDTTALGGIRVVSRVRAREAYRAARGLIGRSMVFFSLVVTASILVGFLLARHFTQPLDRLVQATEEVARGNLGLTLHVATRDEFSRLTSSFNTMTSELARQRMELEQQRHELTIKVKERTKALEEEKRKASEAQQGLLKTTRLATLGEMAGMTAHEVLNPMNNMNMRIERFRAKGHGLRASDVALLTQIVDGWRDAYQRGGVDGLFRELAKEIGGGKKLVEEDIENIAGIARDFAMTLESFREDMEFFSSQISRVTKIVNGMRSMSRVGGERKAMDIHVPLDDTLLTLKDAAEASKVALVREYGQDPRSAFVVVADHEELVQVFSNLVRNALDAVEQTQSVRPPEIRIRTSVEGGRVVVRVVDNGPGVPAEVRQKLFETKVSTKTADRGTGLGLGICRRIIRAFNGDVELGAESSDRVGAEFIVWIPQHKGTST